MLPNFHGVWKIWNIATNTPSIALLFANPTPYYRNYWEKHQGVLYVENPL